MTYCSAVFYHTTYKLCVTCKEMCAILCQICVKCNTYPAVHVQKADFTTPESLARHTNTLRGSERKLFEGVHIPHGESSIGWSCQQGGKIFL